MRRALVLLVALVVLVAAGVQSAEAAPGDITGSLPSSGGTALIVWGGGSTAELAAAARPRGCELVSVWSTAGGTGAFVGYLPGAPEFVNAAFAATFPRLVVPAATPLVLVCKAVAIPTAANEQVLAATCSPIQNEVRSRLTFPSLANFQPCSEWSTRPSENQYGWPNSTLITGYVDSVDVNAAPTRTFFTAEYDPQIGLRIVSVGGQ